MASTVREVDYFYALDADVQEKLVEAVEARDAEAA